MNAAYNKAIMALLGGVVQMLNLWIDVTWLSQDVVASLAAIATMALVYFVPNKQ